MSSSNNGHISTNSKYGGVGKGDAWTESSAGAKTDLGDIEAGRDSKADLGLSTTGNSEASGNGNGKSDAKGTSGGKNVDASGNAWTSGAGNSDKYGGTTVYGGSNNSGGGAVKDGGSSAGSKSDSRGVAKGNNGADSNIKTNGKSDVLAKSPLGGDALVSTKTNGNAHTDAPQGVAVAATESGSAAGAGGDAYGKASHVVGTASTGGRGKDGASTDSKAGNSAAAATGHGLSLP